VTNLCSSALGISRPKNNGAMVLSRGGERFSSFTLRVAGMDRVAAFGTSYAHSQFEGERENECCIECASRGAVERSTGR
jgi:hypothetical protein